MRYRTCLSVLLLATVGACMGGADGHDATSYTSNPTPSNTPITTPTTTTGAPVNDGNGPAVTTTTTTGGSTGTTTGGTSTGGTGTTTTAGGATGPAGVTPGLRVVTHLNLDVCLDIVGGGMTPGTPVRILTCNGDDASQAWIISQGQLRASGNRCLDLAGAPNIGTTLVVNPCNPNLVSQQWLVENGAIKSGTAATPYCTALHQGSTSEGTPVELANCIVGDDEQHWNAADTGTQLVGFYVMAGQDPNSCLILDASNNVLWGSCIDASAAHWTMQGSSAGTAILNGQFCLQTNGDRLVVAPNCTNATNQQWNVIGGQLRDGTGAVCLTAPMAGAPAPASATLNPCQGVSNLGQQITLGAPQL